MKLRYRIEDFEGLEFVVLFEFHKNLDGTIVFDGAWDIDEIWRRDYEDDECITGEVPNADQMVHRWLSAGDITGEDRIYIAAEREFR